MRTLMAQSWEKVTAHQAANYNKKHNYRTFKQGQVIRLFTKNFRFKTDRKLAPYYIPIKITSRINNQAYRVRLPEKYYRIHNVVPILLLKPWIIPHDLEKASLPDLKDDQEVYKPKSIKTYMDTAKGH